MVLTLLEKTISDMDIDLFYKEVVKDLLVPADPSPKAFGEARVKGRSQSPINICTKSAQRVANSSSSLQLHLQDEKMLPMNSGHNFELTVVDGQEKLYADVEGEKLPHWTIITL